MEVITGTFAADTLFGDADNNVINGEFGNDILFGGIGNDTINGGFGDDVLAGGGEPGDLDSLFNTGGRDILSGGNGNDGYFLSLTAGGGSEIREEAGFSLVDDTDVLFVYAENTNIDLLTNLDLTNVALLEETLNSPATFGDSAIQLSRPQAGIVGLEKSGTNLIIDINRDGIAQAQNDLTIVNFFDEQGRLGDGNLDLINNIIDTQTIVDFFEENTPVFNDNDPPATVYRFLNNDTGVHFYTASVTERDSLVNNFSNYAFENTSYRGVDPLTGNPAPLPVYRFLNQDTGVHLYTIDENERNFVQSNLANFSFEGEALFAYRNPVEGTIPIYRFFNPTTGAHFYTPSEAEQDLVGSTLPDFRAEGIAYYALSIE